MGNKDDTWGRFDSPEPKKEGFEKEAETTSPKIAWAVNGIRWEPYALVDPIKYFDSAEKAIAYLKVLLMKNKEFGPRLYIEKVEIR